MDASQANENELQKAIDDITSGAAVEQPGASGDVAAELEAKIQNQMGTPPTPDVSAGVPEMAMPQMPANPVEAMNPETPSIVGSGAPVMVEGASSEAQSVPVTVGAQSGAPVAEDQPAPVAESTPTEVVAEIGETAVESVPEVTGDLGSVKQAMLRDLFPLMDKVELAPEQKYDVYKEMIESTGDKNMIPAAYEAVKGIVDEAAKAEALLYLVNKAE